MKFNKISLWLGTLIIALSTVSGQTQVFGQNQVEDDYDFGIIEKTPTPLSKIREYESAPCAVPPNEELTNAFFKVCEKHRAKMGCSYPTTDADFKRCGYKISRPTPQQHADLDRHWAELQKRVYQKPVTKKNF